VFNRRHHRHGVYRFLHTTAGNNRDYNCPGSDQSVTDSIADAAQGRWCKKESAKDRGVSRSALAVTWRIHCACADTVTHDNCDLGRYWEKFATS
jgi:hypothetical protein